MTTRELATPSRVLEPRRFANEVDVSLVIPVIDEEESVAVLHDQLHAVLDSLGVSYEIVFVDDGSTDNTFGTLENLHSGDSKLTVLRLRRNFGKTAALLSGFEASAGRTVVTLDGDLQDDPAEIPRLLEALHDLDVVSGWKRVRRDPIHKTLPSKIFNLTVRKITGIPLHDFNCGLKAYRREVLQELRLYGELHRFIPVLAHQKGYRVGEIEVRHRPRQYGRSKFGAGRLLKGLLDFVMVLFLTRYLRRPLQLFGVVGLVLWFLGAAGFLYLLGLKAVGQSIFQTHGPLLFLSGIFIVSGILLFMMGLIGEMQRHYAFTPHDEYSVRQRLDRSSH